MKITFLSAFSLFILFSLVSGCSNGAMWRMHDYSPEGFCDKRNKHYMLSVSVSWSGRTFDEVSKKRIRVAVFGPELDQYGSRKNKLFEKEYSLECGKVNVDEKSIEWDSVSRRLALPILCDSLDGEESKKLVLEFEPEEESISEVK